MSWASSVFSFSRNKDRAPGELPTRTKATLSAHQAAGLDNAAGLPPGAARAGREMKRAALRACSRQGLLQPVVGGELELASEARLPPAAALGDAASTSGKRAMEGQSDSAAPVVGGWPGAAAPGPGTAPLPLPLPRHVRHSQQAVVLSLTRGGPLGDTCTTGLSSRSPDPIRAPSTSGRQPPASLGRSKHAATGRRELVPGAESPFCGW